MATVGLYLDTRREKKRWYISDQSTNQTQKSNNAIHKLLRYAGNVDAYEI